MHMCSREVVVGQSLGELRGGSWGRWVLLASTAGLAATQSKTPVWGLLLLFQLAVAALAIHSFSKQRRAFWERSGLLFAVDAGLVLLALLATRSQPLQLFIALPAVLAVALLLRQRVRGLLAGGAMLALVAALGGTVLPRFSFDAVGLAQLTLLLGAALHFSDLSARMAWAEAEASDAQARLQPSAQAQAQPESTSSRSDEVWALAEITEMVGKSLEVAQVMRSVVQRVGDLVNTDSCSILLAGDTGSNGFVMASKGHPEINMLELDLEKYPEVRQAFDSRSAVSIEDVETSPLMQHVKGHLLKRGYRSLLVLPLIFGDDVLGALVLRSRQPFTPQQVRFCKVAAGASANALKNALLFREVQHEAAQNREKGEKLRRLLDSTPDMIVATDTEGHVMEFNDGAEALTGWSAGRAIGHELAEILHTDIPLEANGRSGVDVQFRRDDGTPLEISLLSAPLSGEDDTEVGRVWIGRDVTKLRRVEKSLAQAERLSSLGEVVAGVAHELNNPLSGVVGYAELLRVNATEPEQIRDLDRIVHSSIRCQKIVMKLLSFARQHPPEKKFQSVNDCVRKVLDLKAYHLRASQIETELQLADDLPDTYFDFHQIEQVVLNLLNNGEQAIGAHRKPGRIVLRTERAGEMIRIEVEDSGPGVPPEARERIFDPFFTTKELGEGTGLGLSVSYGIVEEHGGRIELDDAGELGGARFQVLLPIQEFDARELQPVNEDPGGESIEIGPLADSRILVAEDEPLCLELFARVLRDEGANVTLSKDGEEAWEHIQQRDFDLIIVDVRMPNLSGEQLYERVAEERPDLLRRFVFATGDLVRPETLHFLQDLPNRILQKPLEMETVKRVLGQARAAAC